VIKTFGQIFGQFALTVAGYACQPQYLPGIALISSIGEDE
jgi:hypothetical protein